MFDHLGEITGTTVALLVDADTAVVLVAASGNFVGTGAVAGAPFCGAVKGNGVAKAKGATPG